MRRGVSILLLAAIAAGDERADVQRRAEAACADATARLEAYLGRKFKGVVPVDVKSSKEAGAFARAQAEKDTPPELREAAQRVAERLGLVPKGFDIFEKQIEILESSALGFYDPDTDRFYVILGMGTDDPAEFQVTVAHELVHAYRDVDKDYSDRMMRLMRTNSDEAQALNFLVEGDATLLGQALGLAPEALAAQAVEVLAGAGQPGVTIEEAISDPNLAEFPLFLRETLIAPYVEGHAFAGAIFRSGGKAALDKAYDRPPRSTEQVLHPEKFLAKPDEPTEFLGGDPTGALGAGWKLRWTDVLGEFDLRLLFAEKLGRERATEAAAGWDGSRYWLCEKDGAPSFFGAATVWDADGDAHEFAQAWADWALRRDGREGDAGGQGGRWRVETKEGLVVVRQEGPLVLVADGVPADRVDLVLKAMASARRAERKAE